MVTLLDKPAAIRGGLKLPAHKAESLRHPLQAAPLPAVLTVPVSQHIGEPAEPLVKPGDRVGKGQPIARASGYISAPVHAPSSGTVTDVGDFPVPHPSGLSATCIRIRTDGEDRWFEEPVGIADPFSLDPAVIRHRVRAAGIVGLGGAGFPTSVKLNAGPDREVELLVINAAECEPYISCDEALMCARPRDVIEGIRIIRHALQARQVVIGIEDNMPGALQCLREAAERAGETAVRIVPVPSIYPAGGEKQLIYTLTGEEVPSQGLPIDLGIVCHNVGTAAAVYRAVVCGEPLISRIVTVTGGGIREPRNLDVRIGTPIDELIGRCGGYSDVVDRLLMGGPMMGFSLLSDNLPVVKTTNCLLATSVRETPPQPPARACIRCSKCVEVCPAGLLPQQLYWYAHARDFDKIQDYSLFDCIECGCCAQVCPSRIPLVQYYRYAKTEIWDLERQRRKSDLARKRHEFRLERLEREKRELEERRSKAKKALNRPKAGNADAKKAEIEAALARVKARKSSQAAQARNTDNLTDEQRARIAEVDARRAARNNPQGN